jgi:hypothetical protein
MDFLGLPGIFLEDYVETDMNDTSDISSYSEQQFAAHLMQLSRYCEIKCEREILEKPVIIINWI